MKVAAAMIVLATPFFSQTTAPQKKSSTPAKGSTTESPEHGFARNRYESIKHEFEEAQADYNHKLSADSNPNGCSVFPEMIRHPVTVDSVDNYMVGCTYETKKARYVMDKVGEAFGEADTRLRDVDKCLTTYRATIDKKIADQTTRESEQIKVCQAEALYPPQVK